jgi:hypothetical protein
MVRITDNLTMHVFFIFAIAAAQRHRGRCGAIAKPRDCSLQFELRVLHGISGAGTNLTATSGKITSMKANCRRSVAGSASPLIVFLYSLIISQVLQTTSPKNSGREDLAHASTWVGGMP